jgi:MFS family permease
MATEARTLRPPRALPWYAGLEAKHWRILTASFLGWVFDGYEAYALFIVMPFVLRTMLAPAQLASASVYAGTAIGATLLGWGAGGLVGGVLADYIGRKRMMLYSVFLYALFTGLTALSSTFWMFVALRFITGLAMGSEWSTGVALLAETWPNRARPKGAGFLQSGFGVGTLVAAAIWLVLSSWNPLGPATWRLVFVVGALPAVFCLYIRRSIDESERWVAAVKEKRWAATDAAPGASARSDAKRPFTLSEVFREPESRRRVLLAFVASLVTTVGWWAISSWLPEHAVRIAKAQGAANPALWGNRAALLYTAGAVVAYLVSGFVADAIGRRGYLLTTYLGCFLLTPVTYLWTHALEPLMFVSFVNGFFTLGCAYSWMAIYPAELFTSSVRATAASFVFNAARLIAWMFPLMAGLLIRHFGSIPRAAMTIGCIYLLGLVVPWFMPETRGKPLPP